MKTTFRYFLIASLFVVSVGGLAFFLPSFIREYGYFSRSYRHYANYESMNFTYDPEKEEFREISIGYDKPIPQIRIRMRDQRVFTLQLLTEEEATAIFDSRSESLDSSTGQKSVYFKRGFNHASFEAGHLDGFTYGNSDIEFDLDGKGNYERLPISKSRLYKLLGKPNSWETARTGVP